MLKNRKTTASITQAKVAIITVTYNASDFILDYLESIHEFLQSRNSVAIIVDNASTDNTVKIIEQYKHTHNQTQIIIARSEKNIGFGKGCNYGAQLAQHYSSKYLWFLNPDTSIEENSGEELIQILDAKPEASFVGSTLLNQQNIPRPGSFRFPTLLNVFLSNMRLGMLDNLFADHTAAAPLNHISEQADWLTGASFMSRTECFNALNGFDPYYFLYFEEVDLFKRAEKLGYQAWSCPRSHVKHISGASTGINKQGGNIKRQPDYWFDSRRHFYISNYSFLYFLLIDLTFISSHLIWTVRSKIQKKPATTPPHIIKDTLYHGHIKYILSKLRNHDKK